MTHEEIYAKVQSILVDALGVDEEEITPAANLFKDLGAESIDLLDIVFRLERTFGISIARGELFPETLSDPEQVHDGRLTEHGLQKLREQMPHADLNRLKVESSVETLLDLYTVQSLSQFIVEKLHRQQHDT